MFIIPVSPVWGCNFVHFTAVNYSRFLFSEYHVRTRHPRDRNVLRRYRPLKIIETAGPGFQGPLFLLLSRAL
jgi:hypothetical protein